jgi:hypothetical protein
MSTCHIMLTQHNLTAMQHSVGQDQDRNWLSLVTILHTCYAYCCVYPHPELQLLAHLGPAVACEVACGCWV